MVPFNLSSCCWRDELTSFEYITQPPPCNTLPQTQPSPPPPHTHTQVLLPLIVTIPWYDMVALTICDMSTHDIISYSVRWILMKVILYVLLELINLMSLNELLPNCFVYVMLITHALCFEVTHPFLYNLLRIWFLSSILYLRFRIISLGHQYDRRLKGWNYNGSVIPLWKWLVW